MVFGIFAILLNSSSFAQTLPVAPTVAGATIPGVGLSSVQVGNAANANQVDFSSGLTTDVSIGLLQRILGNWHDSNPDPTMGALFKAVNLGILVFAAALFLYVSVVATLHSAEDGEILGKRWGSAFVPLRMSIGMAAIFPLSNGYSLVQIIVLWLATNGVGFANWASELTMENFANNQGMVLTSQLIDEAALSTTMTGILLSETCVAEHNRKFTEAGAPIATYFISPDVNSIKGSTSANSYGMAQWGLSDKFANDPRFSDATSSMCGSIEIQNFNTILNMGNGGGVLSDMVSAEAVQFSKLFKGSNLNDANTALRIAHFAAIVQASNRLRPIALSFVNATAGVGGSSTRTEATATVAAQVAITALEYRQSLALVMNKENMMSITSEMNAIMINGIKTNGWSTLGAWFYQYARIGSRISEMTGYTPKFSPLSDSKKYDDPGTKELLAAVNGAIKQSSENPATVKQIQDASGHFTAGSATGGIVGGIVTGSNILSNGAAKFIGEEFGVDPSNPVNALMQLKNVGDNILTAAEVLYVGKVAVETAGAVTPLGKAVGVVSNAAGSLKGLMGKFAERISGDAGGIIAYVFIFAAFALLGFAMTLAFWLPMAPFILWLGGVMGWIISVLEMVAAAPLWAAAHLHPEGEGMASKYGANGWMIILEVFAKPVLMVVGFFMAARVLDPFLRFASGLFFNNMSTVNSDSVTGIVTTVAFIFMYVGFSISLVHRCFSLIHVIPNSVLRWVGGGGDRFSQSEHMASDMENKIKSYFVAAQTPLGQGGKMKGAENLINRSAKKPGTAQKV